MRRHIKEEAQLEKDMYKRGGQDSNFLILLIIN